MGKTMRQTRSASLCNTKDAPLLVTPTRSKGIVARLTRAGSRQALAVFGIKVEPAASTTNTPGSPATWRIPGRPVGFPADFKAAEVSDRPVAG